MIPLYPAQLLARTQQWLNSDYTPQTNFYFLVAALFNRTGGQSGIPFTVGVALVADGNSQATALALTDDFNEVTSGTGGVMLSPLQAGQFQMVFNGIGVNLNVYPNGTSGLIDGSSNAYVLGNGKTQIYWCSKLTFGGGSYCHSVQLG